MIHLEGATAGAEPALSYCRELTGWWGHGPRGPQPFRVAPLLCCCWCQGGGAGGRVCRQTRTPESLLGWSPALPPSSPGQARGLPAPWGPSCGRRIITVPAARDHCEGQTSDGRPGSQSSPGRSEDLGSPGRGATEGPRPGSPGMADGV